ncbi:MAG: hypothetical protein GXZ07_05380 [Firmicutes bacterium]|nr:hypothetical protein [Bacillota bacterium]
MDFDRWLQRFVNTAEKFLFRGALFFIVMLFIVQALMTEENIRRYLSTTDQLEGEPLAENIQEAFSGSFLTNKDVPGEEYALIIEAVQPPGSERELFILLNGKIAAELKNEPLKLAVSPGDMLEVIGNVTGGTPAVVRIKEVHGTLSEPMPGYEIVTFGERELLAWIIP